MDLPNLSNKVDAQQAHVPCDVSNITCKLRKLPQYVNCIAVAQVISYSPAMLTVDVGKDVQT